MPRGSLSWRASGGLEQSAQEPVEEVTLVVVQALEHVVLDSVRGLAQVAEHRLAGW
jgi:hypothetical protein